MTAVFRNAGSQAFARVGEQPLRDLGARCHRCQNVIQCAGFDPEIPGFTEEPGALGFGRRQRGLQVFKLGAG